MASAFEAAKLDATKYNWEDATDVIRAAKVAEDFMDIVRKDPESLRDNPDLITAFCTFIDRDTLFPNAQNVVPELRTCQGVNLSADTIMNTILRSVEHRRPPMSLADYEKASARKFEEQQMRSMIDYIMLENGRQWATGDELAEADDMYNRTMKIMHPDRASEYTTKRDVLRK